MNRIALSESIFTPASVAIAGVGDTNSGRQYLDSLLSAGFQGRIYPLNPKGAEIAGFKVYRNMKDIPEAVDYVISCLPAPMVPQFIQDCSQNEAKVVALFTAGFSELGSEEGRQLEWRISALARANGIRIIGPNCMGVYCPKVGLSFVHDFPKESGSVALVCQSGGNAIYFVRVAAERGVRFSKVVSYGNGCDIDESDLFDYLAQDDETKMVAAYIEGVKDGERFRQALSHLTARKPVIALKAGCTQAGARTATCHTGSLSGSSTVWNSLLQQAGAIQVQTLDEMIDMVVTFLFMPLPRGRGVAMVGFGGGASVMATDSCSGHGFTVPPVPQTIGDEFCRLLRSQAGLILSNPIELNMPPQISYAATKALITYDAIDLLLANCVFGQHPWPVYDDLADRLCDTVLQISAEVEKPIAVVLNSHVTNTQGQFLSLRRRYCEAGLPVYYSVASASQSINRLMQHHERQAFASMYDSRSTSVE